MKNTFFSKTTILLASLIFVSIILPAVNADLVLDHIQFDPAIVTSGDEVDIVIQFHQAGTDTYSDRVGNPAYTFGVKLSADDSITNQYVIIQDSEGNDLHGAIISGDTYNKKFRVKVLQNAPAGNYAFKIDGQWYKDGRPEAGMKSMRFMMNVKREGINLAISNVISDPERIRSGDKNILLKTEITNSGEKTAKNIQLKLDYPEGITSAYTNNNQLSIGAIDSMQKQLIQFYIDTDKVMKEGVYNIEYTISYQDLDGNAYVSSSSFPVSIKKKPRIAVTNYSGKGLAGDAGEVRVTLKNVGEEKADSVDIRIIKQSSQPFEMDVRSEYLGQMKPGEEATAIFKLNVLSEAELKDHKLNVMIRAKGDSEEGDDNIYTYSDSISMKVTGVKKNNYPLYAGIFAGLVILVAIVVSVMKKK